MTKSLITILKKKGDVLLPCGHPLLTLTLLLFSLIYIYAVDKIHLAIKYSLLLFFSIFYNFFIRISWLIESKAFFKSNNASHVHLFSFFLYFKKVINLNR